MSYSCKEFEQKIECSAADGGTPADGGALLMAGPPADGGAPADGGTTH